MVDPFRPLVRTYWSVFFVVAAVTVPLHVAHATIWHNVIAVTELHGDIEHFPPLRQVHGVGRTQLGQFRVAYWVILAIELALIPLFIRATKRILEVDARGGVTGALDGWRAALSRGQAGNAVRALGRNPAPFLVGAAVAVVVVYLLGGVGGLLVSPLGDEREFAGRGLVDGVARAAAAPFFLVVAALVALGPPRGSSPARPPE